MFAESCCFIGHRDIEITPELTQKVTVIVEGLIKEGVTRFIFGSRSEFNDLCHEVVTRLKEKYPQIVRIKYSTKSEAPVYESEREELEESLSKVLHEEVHLAAHEEIYKPEIMFSSGKASYIERNEIMIDNSDCCVFYYDEDYKPKQKIVSDKSVGKTLTSLNSGTALAFAYAVCKKKRVFNVFIK